MAKKVWEFTQFRERTALLSESGESLTYSELKVHGEKLAGKVSGRGLVFILCTNTIGSVLGYTACINNGIVAVLLNVALEQELLEELIHKYEPSYIWMPGNEKWQKAEEDSDCISEGTLYGGKMIYSDCHYILIDMPYNKSYEIYPELALMLTTSGSTGSPKFVRQSYDNIKVNADSIVQYLKLDETERPITTLPMNYTYGLSIINSHLMVGACILLTECTLMQKQFWQFFKNQGATSFGGVPYTYEMLDKLRLFRMNLPSLRTMTQAGGKLMPELHKKFAEYAQETGRQFVVMYGQCEATARMGYLPYQKSVEKAGSMGIAIPGGKLKLIDVDGSDIAESGKVGELVYEGANVTLGYAECIDDLAKGDERHGVLVTGDMATRDEDGFYFIVGRKKRFLKIYGNRVNLDEIDRMVKAAFDGVDCASTGVDDHMYIFITNQEYTEQVKRYVVEKTKLNPAAFKVEYIEVIPKNDAGKVQYKNLPQLWKV